MKLGALALALAAAIGLTGGTALAEEVAPTPAPAAPAAAATPLQTTRSAPITRAASASTGRALSDSANGVSLDEETKVMKTADELMQTLLNAF